MSEGYATATLQHADTCSLEGDVFFLVQDCACAQKARSSLGPQVLIDVNDAAILERFTHATLHNLDGTLVIAASGSIPAEELPR